METSTAKENPDERLPLIAQLALRFAEACRILAAVFLLMISVVALQWMAGHASYVIRQEMTAIQQLRNLGVEKTVAVPSTADESRMRPPFVHAQVEVPVIGGLVSVSVPPVAWLIFCIFATVAIVIFVVSLWRMVINMWVTARACIWSSFTAALGCLFQWIWTIVATIVTVVITLLAIIFVIYNIVAFFAAL